MTPIADDQHLLDAARNRLLRDRFGIWRWTMKFRGHAIALAAMSVCSSLYAEECEVSLPDQTDIPDFLLFPPEGFVWVGSSELTARVPEEGRWTAMGPEYNYRDKWWWWREGYRAIEESQPELSITAKRLDSPAPPVSIPEATSALGENGDLMLLMMEFPTAGCWEVVGKYYDHELRFVFEVGG